MSFTFGYSPFLLAACILAAGALTVWSYRRTVPPLSGWRKAVPATLRFVALTTILFLLAQPVLRRVDEIERNPILAVLVDNSESLQVTTKRDGTSDNESPSLDARSSIRSALQSVESLDGAVRVFAFDRDVRPIGTSPNATDSLRLDGARTNLAAAIDAARTELQGENLACIALLSDGQYNAGRNPLYTAERSPVPIHTVTLGDTTGARDVQVRRVTTNDIAYVGTELPVQAAIRATQAAGEQVTVRLSRDGNVLDNTTVTLPSGTSERTVQLSFTPENAGLQSLTVSVSSIEGEATERNNAASKTVRVLESKRRVLLLAGAPSPDVGALRRILSRDTDTELTARVVRQDGRYYDGQLPEDLTEFDVLALVGYPSTSVSDGDLRRVADAVSDGTPVVFFMQPTADLGRLSAFSDALPVSLDRARSSSIEALIRPTERGSQHPIMDVENAGTAPWDQLPPLRYNESRWSTSPDARILATIQVRSMELDDPALVIRSRVGQRSAALLASGTWRWTNLPDDLAPARTVWPGVISNLVRWVAARQDTRPVRVQPVQQVFAGSERVEFTGQVYNESQEPISDANISVEITAEDGTEYPLTMEPANNGQYNLDVGVLPEGTYSYSATAVRGNTTVGSDTGEFSVGELTVEYRETRADPVLMRQIAERSGGVALLGPEADRLSEVVQQTEGFKATTFQQEQETELWRTLLFLALILACLAGEWTLRKRFGLV
ncbi:hypothetical protein CRI94_01215 [Longibacter salinarum]|uniref:VWFA domain-containing protein n=1 Tax=Longibacter salinarum TaxID=1850348 RepID=A0A2A8D228_9BACT|nr:hypothetical protein [Longibacter salinarum]PEN14941.1 hypothetical protein CRI94_01215 [Longibacter salinarum]